MVSHDISDKSGHTYFFPLLNLIIQVLFFTSVFLFLEYGIGVVHELSVFTSFLLLPGVYLWIVKKPWVKPYPAVKQDIHENGKVRAKNVEGREVNDRIPFPEEGMEVNKGIQFPDVEMELNRWIACWDGFTKRLNRGFLEGLLIYCLFGAYVLIYFFIDPDFFEGYDKSGWGFLSFVFLTALNVMPVDFFTKRFIQLPLSRCYGATVAISLQTLVWLAAHYPESLWLSDLMGPVGVWVFLGFTGLVTGISYERTKNVEGQMTGHVLLNVLVVGMAKL